MIQLQDLELHNFISHKSTTLDFTDLQGLVMIDGNNADGKFDSNGAGKSTILEGILWNLTGETIRKMGVNGMVNRSVGKNTMTHSKFLANGAAYDVTRYRKDDKEGDNLHFSKDNVDISKRLNKDTQGDIDGILGVPFNVLTSTIFLGEGLSSKFTQLGDSDKKNLIESTLNLPYDLGKSRDEANKALKETGTKLATARGRTASLKAVLADLDRTALTAKAAQLTSNISVTESELARLDSERIQADSIWRSAYNEKTRLSALLATRQQLESQRSSVMDYVTELKQLWANAGNSGVCSVCNQPIVSAESVKHAQDHYMQELNKQATVLTDISDRLNQCPEVADLRESISNQDKLINEGDESLKRVTAAINQNSADVAQWRAELSHSDDLLQNADKYEKDVTDTEVLISQLEKQEIQYKYWYNAFSPSGLVVKILQEAIDYLNERLAIYTEMLLDRVYRVELNASKVTLKDSLGATYETLSNGEKRRLDISIQFALHDYVHTYCGIQFDTLFIDEVLDTLDPVGISNIIELLRVKLDYCGLERIFVITHNQDLKQYFDRVLLVSKDIDGTSTLSII